MQKEPTTKTDSKPKRIFKSNAKIVQTREYKMLCSQEQLETELKLQLKILFVSLTGWECSGIFREKGGKEPALSVESRNEITDIGDGMVRDGAMGSCCLASVSGFFWSNDQFLVGGKLKYILSGRRHFTTQRWLLSCGVPPRILCVLMLSSN